MDLTFQMPIQYCSYSIEFCLPPDTSTTVCCFCFDLASSLFLELLVIALCSSPVAYWTPSELGWLIFWCHIFWTFHTEHGVLAARLLEWVAISSSNDYAFLEFFTMTCLSWVALHGMAHSFIELCIFISS